jgi:hypothetical protein
MDAARFSRIPVAPVVERARAIAERRAGEPTSTRPRSAGVKPALADRLAALLADRSGGTAYRGAPRKSARGCPTRCPSGIDPVDGEAEAADRA